MGKSALYSGFDLLTALETPEQAQDTLATRIKVERSKFDTYNQQVSTSVGRQLFGLKRAINALEVVPSSPVAEQMWSDYKAKQEANGEKFYPYYVWLAKGDEARARAWSMTRMLEKGASQEDVFFMHSETVAQYKAILAEYNSLLSQQ